ncbi:MAG TPA: EF-P lysine aminoacylase GenX [Planctomycetaceae bacterium]|nr:EF-P lysine aminoacylase GenX [Planctomycetaceae bacterium]HIQ19748.1 EF-P lysine aminoacylase GenX [Planctomycetota bacterium]
MAVGHPPQDFQPTADWDTLRLRAGLLRRVRQFFDGHGFLEVETPLLSAETVVDRHLDPFAVAVDRERSTRGDTPRFWLQTSPEMGMKRMLAAGAAAIYQVSRSFRRGEEGPLHNPEFTIVEWYRRGDDMAAGIDLLDRLCQVVLGSRPAERLSYAEAFARHLGIDPHRAGCAELDEKARQLGIAVPETLPGDDRDSWLDLLLAEQVAPRLGLARPTILYDYPATQAALARVRPGQPPVAERFELFISGMELANGYHELLDPDELARRTRQANAQRVADGKEVLPEPRRLLAAMRAGLPPSTGVALGFDRLVMVATGASRLEQVMPFPFSRA